MTATSLGGGLYRINAEVENAGYLPTSTSHGVLSRSVKPTMVQLGVAPDRPSCPATRRRASFPRSPDRAGARVYQWIVRGKPGQAVVVKAVAQKGGAAERSVTLK